MIPDRRKNEISQESFTGHVSDRRVVSTFDLDPQPISRIFVTCDQRNIAPVWGYILSQHGLAVALETHLETATDRWYMEKPELGVIDISNTGQDLITLCKKFRAVSMSPLLLFLPAYDEKLILEAYAAGVDEVVVKPISPAIFLAKIINWVRRSTYWRPDGVSSGRRIRFQLNAAQRYLIDSGGHEIKLTHLEVRLLTILMSRAAHAFSAEDIIRGMWGRYRPDDQILLTNIVYRLRKKIETEPSQPRHLQRWHGGYSFHP